MRTLTERRTNVAGPMPGALLARNLVLQRKCACGGTCEECQKKKLQRRAAGAGGPSATPSIVRDVLRSPGRPLDVETRSFFEPRLGHSFENVRVHTDHAAAESARAVNALAYTVGNDVVFGVGQFAPRSSSGQKLLAHELTHVAQQSAQAATRLAASSLEVGSVDDAAEKEAERFASQIMDAPGSPRTVGHGQFYSQGSEVKLRRQPGGGSGEDEPKKEPAPLVKWGDYGLDFKPIIPGPIEAPSVEDVHKGIEKLREKGEPPNVTCPQGWRLRYGNLCCPGLSVDVDRCCPTWRMTMLGRCCAPGQVARGIECKKEDTPPPPPTPQPKGGFRLHLPPPTPLTVNFPIHFNHNQPGAATASEKALRSSLTTGGQRELDMLIGWLKRDAKFSVQVTGMASVEGSKSQNDELGKYRALSVAYVLMANGIDVQRFSDPPGVSAACPEIGVGLHNCGATLASTPKDENDRQVRAVVFVMPKGIDVSASSP